VALGVAGIPCNFPSYRVQRQELCWRANALPANHSRILYPRKEAAFQLGISLRALDYLVSGKRIRCQKIGSRTLFHHRELERFASSNHYASVVEA
jgi:hypothetical protein